MKKLILIVVIIGTIAFFFLNKSEDVNVEKENKPAQTENFKPDPSLASFSGIENSATILDDKAYGDLNNDDKEDVAVLLAETGGGSGVFIHIAAYVSGPVNYKGTNAMFLGDRIAPQSISISNGVITVNYLDRKEDEPFAAEPTVKTFKQFVYKNGELVEK